MNAQALLGVGKVWHRRLRPQGHAFAYTSCFWLLPMRSLARQPQAAVARNARAAMAFHDADHGEGGPDALAWFDGLLRDQGLWCDALAQGEVWLQTYPRTWGHAFKPVSFWYAHRDDGRLHAVVAEVNNTFGERHCYLLSGPDLGWGRELSAHKVFHVSPFCEARGTYRFRFLRSADRMVARVDYDDLTGPVLQTALSGRLEPLNAASIRQAVWQWPWLTLGVVVRIHWQAARLWLKRVPFFRKPVALAPVRQDLPPGALSTSAGHASVPSHSLPNAS